MFCKTGKVGGFGKGLMYSDFFIIVGGKATGLPVDVGARASVSDGEKSFG